MWKTRSGYNGGRVELTVGQQVKDQFTVIEARRHRDQHDDDDGDGDDHGTDAALVATNDPIRIC